MLTSRRRRKRTRSPKPSPISTRRNKELTARNEKLQAESGDLNKQLAAKDDLLQKKSEEIARQDAKQAAMVNEVERMKAQQAKSGGADIKESPAAGKSAGLKSIRMKVLSGEGKIDSAKRMAKRLTAMGYKVESVAMAENADYPANTVYFTEKYKKEAKTLAIQAWQEYHRETPYLEIRLQHHRRDGGMIRKGTGYRVSGTGEEKKKRQCKEKRPEGDFLPASFIRFLAFCP